MGDLRQEIIEEIAHKPALSLVYPGDLPDVVIEVIGCEIAVEDHLGKEIGVKIGCLLDTLNRMMISFGAYIHPIRIPGATILENDPDMTA